MNSYISIKMVFTVIKRNSNVEDVDFNKITNRIKKLCSPTELSHINTTMIAQKTIESIYPNIPTQELDIKSADICATYMSSNPWYGILGGRILASNLQKNLEQIYNLKTFSSKLLNINDKLPEFLNKEFVAFIAANKERLDPIIDYSKDYDIDYFGFKTLEKAYLIKVDEAIMETPQDLWMRVAINIHYRNNGTIDEMIDKIQETYTLLSNRYFIHATPTLFNSGTNFEQMSSCFLLGTDDSLSGIFKTITDCGQISKWAGGIGVHVSNIRALNSTIKSTNGKSSGIIPMLKVYNSVARYCNQSGKRNGSIAVYLEPWHADVFDFLELKLNTGAEELRARDLFLALWVPDLFMSQVKNNGEWYLMSPDTCPNLNNTYGAEFEELYWKYVKEGRYVKKVDASKLWEKILISQIETGVPYICYKDNVNHKSNQKNIGVIKSSNLCSEITEYSDANNYAVCNLASIAVNRFLSSDGTYDWDLLHKVAKIVTFNLNNIIDHNYYPTPETKKTNDDNRPIGIGIQGLGDLYYMLKLPYESQEAIDLDAEIMETIYHGAVEMSIELAEKHGPYKNFAGSPFSKGLFQFDLWNIKPQKYDWSDLKEKIQKVGIRNSLLTALMPTATTSQILGNCECFEIATSNIYTRKTMAGTFMMINKYLIEDLKQQNLWNLNMKDELINNRGSIQNIKHIPDNIKQIYKTIWEVKQRAVIDHATARGAFVDQSQSMNLFLSTPTYDKITSCLFYGWEKGLKTGCYYLRILPSVSPLQFSQEAKPKNSDNKTLTKEKEEVLFCSLANPEACASCSA